MLRQIWIVSALSFKSLKSRFWQSMVIVVGLGATIGVLLSMMSMTVGLRAAYDRLDLPDPDHASPDLLEELLANGDSRFEAWLAEAVDPLRQAIDVLELALDPETVVVGGFMPLPVIEALVARLEPLHLSVSSTRARSTPRVLVGAAGKDTSVLGAAALPIFSETNPQFDVLQKPLG